MAYAALARGLVTLLLAVSVFAFFGCGGGVTTPTPIQKVVLVDPVENPELPGAVGGTLFSLLNAVIDYPYNATMTLSGMTDKGAAYTDTTQSTLRGGYRFVNVPAGLYTVTATAASTRIDDLTLTATLQNVRVRGNIPAMMMNLLLGKADDVVTFTGTITRSTDHLPVSGATVTVDVSGFTTDHLQGLSDSKVSVLVTTTTGVDGTYRLVIPAGGKTYYIAAHNAQSMVSESEKMVDLAAGDRTVDLALDAAVAPSFDVLPLDMLSATLPAPTAAAGMQALVTRLAVARALHAPSDRISRLEKMARTRDAAGATRAATGWVENDLYWSVPNGDVGVRGFHIYRSTVKEGPYTYVGTAPDPYMLYFFDSDPALQSTPRTFYTVTSYAANGQVSDPARPFLAEPLPQIEVTGPAEGAEVPQAGAQVTWNAVAGAKSYLVMVYYNAPPSFNMTPIRSPLVYKNGETGESFADLPAGDYWWSVSAYNTEDPNFATAATYSAYRKITIQ